MIYKIYIHSKDKKHGNWDIIEANDWVEVLRIARNRPEAKVLELNGLGHVINTF